MTKDSQTKIQVHLVDDHPATREGLRRAIDLQPDMMVCGESTAYDQALRSLYASCPDVLVLDLNLSDGNGWTLIGQLQAKGALPPTLVLSVCDETLYARRLLRAGAQGYLMKDEPVESILQAIRSVHRGKRVASDAISNQLIAEALNLASEANEPSVSGGDQMTISDRELQVFGLLASDMTNKEIAAHLGLSEKTVSTYKVSLMKKMGIRSAAKLAELYKALIQPAERPVECLNTRL